MINMKIMYVVSDDIYRNTSANIRNVSLIRGLLDYGHTVQVVCMHQKTPIDRELANAIKGSKVTHINSPAIGQTLQMQKAASDGLVRKLKKLAVKIYNMIRIYDPNIRKVKRIKLDTKMFDIPDVILSSSDPRSSHVLALRIRKCINFTGVYVQYWGDPMLNDISASNLVSVLLKITEHRLLNSANLIVYTNEAVRDYMCQLYNLAHEKTLAIPTSCAVNKTVAKVPPCLERKIRLGYFGGYHRKTRNMKPIFEAVLKNPDLHLTIAGDNDYDVPKSERIHYYPRVSAQKIAELQENVDILIVVENIPKATAKNNCFQIPGKVYHYGITNKKVLVICETGITKTLLDQYGRYAFCENTADAIGEKIVQLYYDNSPQLSEPIKDFLPKNIAAKLINAIKEIEL